MAKILFFLLASAFSFLPLTQAEEKIPVSATEDLMREHGLLNRILLIYEEAAGKLKANQDYPLELLHQAAGMIKTFIEDYHEKLEEDFIFPVFEKKGRLQELTVVLRQQHDAGRKITDDILKLTDQDSLSAEARVKLIEDLQSYVRMYRPHAARESTVLFPALHDMVSPQDFERMGEAFEKEEERLFGDKGFEVMVGKTADLEKTAGLEDLTQFTPHFARKEFI